MKLHEEIEQNFKKNVQEFSAAKRATKSATKSAQWLCCTFDKAICVYQVSGNSLLIFWILYWGYKLYLPPI